MVTNSLELLRKENRRVTPLRRCLSHVKMSQAGLPIKVASTDCETSALRSPTSVIGYRRRQLSEVHLRNNILDRPTKCF